MVFSSTMFLFVFLPMFLSIYYFARERFRNLVLLIASLLFYTWGEPKNIVIMIVSIIVNYFLGIIIDKHEKYKKIFLVVAVAYNLSILFVFKYLGFSIGVLNRVTGSSIQVKSFALPIGISFYTFQIMSYVIDVYRKNVRVQKNILNLALYISLFPQLIAGPIVRYIDIEKQIENRKFSWNEMYLGICRFMIGFSKKILIADQLAVLVDIIFVNKRASMISNWVGIIAYTLQIYFDFSGYSDMAIGLGKMFGFDFLENFEYPYISKSVKEFWRRWHISLGSWFRDYLYIPLGGSKCGKIRTFINLIVVFFLTGLWHGASFNFIVWGIFYVVFLIMERMGLEKILEKSPDVVRHIYTILVIMIGWVFFRADTLSNAIEYINGMFSLSGNDVANFNYVMNLKYWFCIIIGIYFSFPHVKLKKLIGRYQISQTLYVAGICIIFFIAICYMVGSGYSPFLYFRF